MPIELDLEDEDDESIEKALDSAPERDLVDLAGILGHFKQKSINYNKSVIITFLGMHNVLNQPQYYNALKGKGQNEETGTTFTGVIKAYQPRNFSEIILYNLY